MSRELLMRAQSDVEPVLDDPRDGDETEVVEKGGGGGETKRALVALCALGPREGDDTKKFRRRRLPQRCEPTR
jgi:hypothetical protein